MSHDRQEVGRRQSGRPSADHRNLLAGIVHLLRYRNISTVIHRETFETSDVDRRVYQNSSAALLAWMLTDQRADRRERIILTDQSDSVRVPFMLEQRNVTRNIHAGRTHRHTRYRLYLLLDIVRAGMIFDMRFKVVPVSLQASEHHIGGFKADRAVRGDADGFCGSFQQLQRFHPRLRIHFQNVVNHHLELSQTDATWRALAAAL